MSSGRMRMDLDDDDDAADDARNADNAADAGGISIEDLVSSKSNYMSAADAAISAQIDSRKFARSIAVPTSDPKVRRRLRQLKQPITCFGEREMDRRERLRALLANLLQQAGDLVDGRDKAAAAATAAGQGSDGGSDADSDNDDDSEKEEEFFTQGSQRLVDSRRTIAAYSLKRAKQRIAQQRLDANVPLTKLVALRKRTFEPIKQFTNLGSQIGGDRPISMTRFSPDASLLATGSWSGSLKLWNIPSASERATLRAHSDKVGGVAWHPKATIGQSSGAVNLVTGAADATVCLWSLDSDRPLATLKGHEGRVARTAFHPTGAYVASAAFDGTWRLWDVESAECLLIQEGHSKEVYSVEFQDDGALIASGGLDAIGRVWDTRTGRTAMVLDGHVKEILSIDFAPNGHQVATASGDDTVRIWDMRALKSIYTIPAHKSSVADVRFFRSQRERRAAPWLPPSPSPATNATVDVEMSEGPAEAGGGGGTNGEGEDPVSRSGSYLATAGYDGLVKVWSADDWQLLKTLKGDGGRVMSVDISSDGEYIASGEWSRTFKLWGAL
ncbi:uncharacterized protein PFL1_05294 [Pseudozyma flocculosa PF-1]|uniref:Related to PRP4 - U4/U6 small nuclear ribonucleoprotein n=2 Tax=Pseudozyma flocculosa TaxID=84751 RepID=A0A5C3FCX3_9BASI|nr:uncharacterized protein PFL1_05294 [Pseudozyma flocculosa PF-1]EPQ27010.1 hypothetical protein PFL1_05294 [Pseudozyma flocculosa PF-1]SPO42006.1 related to PRP4 - U4/U6 small nuclear ribonucleoprotein [Pseudozyma flocculosa]